MGVIMDQAKQRRKWIWGCTGGCLGFLVAAAVALFLIALALKRPVPIVPPETFVTPRTEAFVFVKVAADDPLMVKLAVQLAMLREFLNKVPAAEGGSVQLDAERAQAMVLQTAPVQIVLVLQAAAAEGSFDRAAALSVYRYSRLYGLIARRYMERASGGPQAGLEEYKDALISVTKEGRALGLFQNNYMAADRLDTVRYWVDRVLERRTIEERAGQGPLPAPEMAGSAQLKAAYSRLQPGKPIVFACLNSRRELAALLTLMPEGEPRTLLEQTGAASDRVVSLSGELSGLNDRDAALTLFIECADAGFAAQLEAALTQVAAEYGKASPLEDLKATQLGGGLLKVEARVENLADKVSALVRYLAQKKSRQAA